MNPMNSGRIRSGGGQRGDVIPKGYQKDVAQLQQFTPDQMQLFKQMFGQVGPDSYLSKLAAGDESQFAEMEAPAQRQFSGLLGGLSSRFSQGSGQGSMGLRRSSGFQNTGTAAASNFAQELQANRQNLQRQAIQDLMGMSNTLLGQRPYERMIVPKQEEQNKALGGWGGLLGGVAGGIGGSFFGMPVQGAALGASAFSGL